MFIKTKTHSIVDDYEISDKVLGRGVDGDILLIEKKRTRKKFALKVNKNDFLTKKSI